ncbi:MAG: hypothetical protein COU35_03920 [Candidatus Magasanikbacteria bacterium CG10_big_fil_rev_8_21_14_0_10_47_10]|uniref:Uncharacterized protein n=1 Tax=Candidatus Magasanikbacteria bacterium CG10_big_fil_rev_8_21_14_0_10_47_10 TaxID=1974652 RepID=A0A2H0TPT4_9BACT|nr:MAG: hypothetical protein COU35_03920 [Candidatus Magasanikbacteria bacterium CG10_big_fil_rev_8_21_14_0_10_47_10]
MLVISNHLLTATPLNVPADAVIRINVAWLKDRDALVKLLGELVDYDVYLDYPQGRSKPPRPSISLEDTITLVDRFPHIKHFAVSNVEDPEEIYKIRVQLPPHVGLVPKIETKTGIDNLESIIQKIDAKYIMLDKEDLYIDIDRDHELFMELIEQARQKAKACGIDILELHGVIFHPYRENE